MNKFLDEKINLHETSWKPAYPLFSKVINQFHLQLGVELGLAFGGHSEAMLSQTNIDKLYSVDRYQHDPSYDDSLNFAQEQFDELYEYVKNRLSIFGDRCELIRADSEKAVQTIPDGLDFVYIDADHSYNGVFRDLCLWSRKIRDGGIIAGHDYGHVNIPGVKIAVDQFFSRFNWTIHEEGEGVWWVEKKKQAISFIIPAFNCADMIEITIASIFDGNFTDGDEVIIVDDCSTDSTADVIKDSIEKHPDIKLLAHKVNKGTAAAARNTGIENAINELIFCLDSDNILESMSIPKLKEYLFNQGADVAAFGELRYFTEDVSQITHKWIFRETITLSDALAGIYWPGPSGNYLFTRSGWQKAGRYFEPFLENQTLDSWTFGIRQLGTGQKMVTLPGTGYLHRYGHQSHYVKNSLKGNVSLSALIGIIPFLDQIEETDINYIFSKTGRLTWMDKLDERSIRVKNDLPGQTGKVENLILLGKQQTVNIWKGFASILKKVVRRFINK